MILGFAQFGKQLRKLKKTPKNSHEKAMNEAWKIIKKGIRNWIENHEKTSQKTTRFSRTSKNTTKSHFWRVPASVYPQQYDSEPICNFPTVPKWSWKCPLGLQKSAKGAVAFLEQFRLIGTGADLVLDILKKVPKSMIRPIWDRF